MPPKAPLVLPTHTFPTSASFTTFLSKNHTTLPGLYLQFAKKTSGIPSITPPEAIECALCYGWIDGRANALDSNYWTVRYTPRRPKSIWSQKNVETVGRLIEDGRMQTAGLATVEAAKSDGRWARAYAGSATISVPADLEEALEGSEDAKRFFSGLSKTDRYGILMKLQIAREKGREKRIEGIVSLLAEGKITGSRAVKKELDEDEDEELRIKSVPAKRKIAGKKKAEGKTIGSRAVKKELDEDEDEELRNKSVPAKRKIAGKRKAEDMQQDDASLPLRRAGLRQRT